MIRHEARSLGRHTLYVGDCLDVMAGMDDKMVDAIVTDPPYGIGFMGRKWDALPPGGAFARQAYRVAKPGAHIVAFSSTRTVHRLAVALEDAGWEIRDTLHWCYFSGFPKSLDVSKAIDKAAGAEREVVAEVPAFGIGGSGTYAGHATGATCKTTIPARQWQGWGTALKPAVEPAIIARKKLDGTVAANVLKWGVGALNIDAARFGYGDPAWVGPSDTWLYPAGPRGNTWSIGSAPDGSRAAPAQSHNLGRWPANLYYCPKPSTAEREAGCEGLRQQSAGELTGGRDEGSAGLDNPRAGAGRTSGGRGNIHPTVKPIRLMRWIVDLVTPPGGVVLEPFAGSGTTVLGVELSSVPGARCVAIEREAEYVPIIKARFAARDVLRRMQSRAVSAPERHAIAAQIGLFTEDIT